MCVADVGKLQIAKMGIQPRVDCAFPKLEGLRCYGASAPVRVNRGGQELVRLLTECQKRDGLLLCPPVVYEMELHVLLCRLLCQTHEFREPKHAAVRSISGSNLNFKGQQVMLADGPESDPTDNDHLI